MVLVIDISGS